MIRFCWVNLASSFIAMACTRGAGKARNGEAKKVIKNHEKPRQDRPSKGGDGAATKVASSNTGSSAWRTAQRSWCLHGLRKIGAPAVAQPVFSSVFRSWVPAFSNSPKKLSNFIQSIYPKPSFRFIYIYIYRNPTYTPYLTPYYGTLDP